MLPGKRPKDPMELDPEGSQIDVFDKITYLLYTCLDVGCKARSQKH